MPFVDTPWEDPESKLSPEDYCAVCLIDMNEPGKEKLKKNCKLPVRRRPGGPYNIRAMRAAAQAILGARGGLDAPREERLKAARKLIRLFREAGVKPPENLLKFVGVDHE